MTQSEKRCSVCKKRGSTCERHLEQMSVLQTKKRKRRRKRGLCLDCKDKAIVGMSRCEFHRALKNERDRVSAAARRRAAKNA